MSRRQHHRSMPSKGELSTEVMGSPMLPSAAPAGCVGATPTSTRDGHRAPCNPHPTDQRTSDATGQEDMQQTRLPGSHHRITVHHACTRGRQGTRHHNGTRIRHSARQGPQGSSAAGSDWHRELCTLWSAHQRRRGMAPGPQQRQNRVPRPESRALQHQRRRKSLPSVRLNPLGTTPYGHGNRQTAGEVARKCGGFKIFEACRRRAGEGWSNVSPNRVKEGQDG